MLHPSPQISSNSFYVWFGISFVLVLIVSSILVVVGYKLGWFNDGDGVGSSTNQSLSLLNSNPSGSSSSKDIVNDRTIWISASVSGFIVLLLIAIVFIQPLNVSHQFYIQKRIRP